MVLYRHFKKDLGRKRGRDWKRNKSCGKTFILMVSTLPKQEKG